MNPGAHVRLVSSIADLHGGSVTRSLAIATLFIAFAPAAAGARPVQPPPTPTPAAQTAQAAPPAIEDLRSSTMLRPNEWGTLVVRVTGPCGPPSCFVQIGRGVLQPFGPEPNKRQVLLDVGRHVVTLSAGGSNLTENVTIEGRRQESRTLKLPAPAAPPRIAAPAREGTITVSVDAPARATVGAISHDILPDSEFTFAVPFGEHTVKIEASNDNRQAKVSLSAESPAVRLLLFSARPTPPPPPLGGEMTWVAVAGGPSVEVGCVDGDAGCRADEKPRKRVNVSPFQMMATEVTVGRFEEWLKGQPPNEYERPEWTTRIPLSDLDRHPAVNVTWAEAMGFCRSIGARLPGESEWEAAARGGRVNRMWAWDEAADPLVNAPAAGAAPGVRAQSGGVEPIGGALPGNFADEAAKRKNPTWRVLTGYDDNMPYTAPVASFRPFHGLYDLAGNVWEWTSDDYSDGKRKVARGGSWTSTPPLTLRISHRLPADPARREDDIGFRCVK
jgi:formylglycine-generating enzyme required for sulfatase activity